MALEDQTFGTYAEWDANVDAWLVPADGRGDAICLDAKGRRCEDAGDFLRARTQDTFPVRWFWPDQVANALGQSIADKAKADARIAILERWCGLTGSEGYSRDMAERHLEWVALSLDGQRKHMEEHYANATPAAA